MIALVKGNELDEINYIKFETLFEHIDVNTLESYDKEHYIVTLNNKLIDTLSAFKVPM